jgi:hypothetical protein
LENNAYKVLMPGAQGIKKYGPTTASLQREMRTNINYEQDDNQFVGSTTQPRVSYPRLHLTHPWIPDETGYMRFRYVIRMIAVTHFLLHLYPDISNTLPPYLTQSDLIIQIPQFWHRQTIYLPRLSNNNAKMKNMVVAFAPYELTQ